MDAYFTFVAAVAAIFIVMAGLTSCVDKTEKTRARTEIAKACFASAKTLEQTKACMDIKQ